jgi:hypothetical protein
VPSATGHLPAGLAPGSGSGHHYFGDSGSKPDGGGTNQAAPTTNADGSTTTHNADGSTTQTMPAGTDQNGNPTTDVRTQDKDGNLTQTTTGSDKNGNPQETVVKENKQKTRVEITVKVKQCGQWVETRHEIWVKRNETGMWYLNGDHGQPGSNAPPATPTAPK